MVDESARVRQARVSGPLGRWTGALPAGQGPRLDAGPVVAAPPGEVPAGPVVLGVVGVPAEGDPWPGPAGAVGAGPVPPEPAVGTEGSVAEVVTPVWRLAPTRVWPALLQAAARMSAQSAARGRHRGAQGQVGSRPQGHAGPAVMQRALASGKPACRRRPTSVRAAVRLARWALTTTT